MMKMTVEPRQIESDYDNAFLNPVNAGGGGVGVWGCAYVQPTYLLLDAKNKLIFFVTFANLAWAREWLEKNKELEIVWKFEPEEKLK